MSNAHIVFTHSSSTGVIRKVVHVAAHTLAHAGWTVETTDLDYWLDIQTESKTTHQAANSSDEEFSNVADCDVLVLVFPVIWCSVPARLKQWIEMVFSDRLACGCMQGKRALIVAVSEEADRIQHGDSIDAALTDLLRPLLEGTLNYLGFKVLRPFLIHRADGDEGSATDELLIEVATAFSRLDRRSNFYGLLRPVPGSSHLSMF